jgi:hypothetical protein
MQDIPVGHKASKLRIAVAGEQLDTVSCHSGERKCGGVVTFWESVACGGRKGATFSRWQGTDRCAEKGGAEQKMQPQNRSKATQGPAEFNRPAGAGLQFRCSRPRLSSWHMISD